MWTRNRFLGSVMVLLTSGVLVAGRGGSGGGSGGGAGGGGGGGAVTDNPVPTETETTGSGSTGSGSTWSANADVACRQIYDNRGRPPRSESGDLDDDMALAEDWRGNLAFRAARDLTDLPGAPSGAVSLVTALLDYQKASVQVAEVHLEGGYQPTKLSAAEAAQNEARESVEHHAAQVEAPSCGRLVNTTE